MTAGPTSNLPAFDHLRVSSPEFDLMVHQVVADYLTAIERNRVAWQRFTARALAGPAWLRWLYWDRTPIPAPRPPQLPACIVARARELGLLPQEVV